MASSPTVLDSDFRYIDKKGNLMKTRTELTIAQMLAFLEQNYEYNYELSINGKIVMVELVGQMKNDMVIDFGDAKKIIKEVITILDHKFFINRKYLKDEDDSHFRIGFEGPKGMFDLKVPKNTTYLLEGEATVENLSTELIKILAPKLPPNVEAIGVYIYEGFNKGAHIIAKLDKQ